MHKDMRKQLGTFVLPLLQALKAPPAKQNQEMLSASIEARFKETQRDTGKLEHSICHRYVLSSMTWLPEFLGFTSGAESVLCGTWCTHFAGDSRCYPCILHLSFLRYQATKKENQKDSIVVSWGLSWGELFSNAFYTERRHRHCHVELQHLGLVFTCTYGRSPSIYLDICTSQGGLHYIIREKKRKKTEEYLPTRSHYIYIIESYIY